METKITKDNESIFNYFDKDNCLVMQVHYPKGRNPYILHINPTTGLPIKDRGKKHREYPLFHLPILRQNPDALVYLVDDEETADILRQFNPPYCSTTYIGNQKIWRLEYNRWLAGRDVAIILCKPDEEEKEWYQEVIYRLMTGFQTPDKYGQSFRPASSVRYCELQTNTVLEYIASNRREAFDRLINQTAPLTEMPERPDLEGLTEAEITLKRLLGRISLDHYAEILTCIAELSYEGQKDAYIKVVAKKLDIDVKAIRKDLMRDFDSPTGPYGSEEQEIVAEVLTYLYHPDDPPSYEYGSVGEFTEQVNRITGERFTSQKVGRILKRLGIVTVTYPDDPKRTRILKVKLGDIDAIAQRYDTPRHHSNLAKMEEEFALMKEEEQKKKAGYVKP